MNSLVVRPAAPVPSVGARHMALTQRASRPRCRRGEDARRSDQRCGAITERMCMFQFLVDERTDSSGPLPFRRGKAVLTGSRSKYVFRRMSRDSNNQKLTRY